MVKLLFRTDASNKIGTGHVMRCITLAQEVHRQGGQTCFVLRDADQNVIDLLDNAKIEARIIFTKNESQCNKLKRLPHDEWLPVSQTTDAIETLGFVFDFKPDWVVADHYSLDANWHSILKQNYVKIMVIDDLGDRKLNCDLLLDQNLGANAKKYRGKVSKNCKLLLGPEFALLRDEFKNWRGRSLKNRINKKIEKILITLGGADPENYTLKILAALHKSANAKKCELTVIIGGSYSHRDTLNEFLDSSDLNISVLTNVTNMAHIMSNSDLCIGAAGSTSWERCCLGLPTIAFAVADNQRAILDELEKNKAAVASSLENIHSDIDRLIEKYQYNELKRISIASSLLCDGFGAQRVFDQLEFLN